MASAKSANSVKSVIVLLLTLVIVAAVLIYLSAEKPTEIDSGPMVISSKRAKVDMKGMYQKAGSPVVKKPVKKISTPASKPIKKPVPVKRVDKAPVKSVSQKSGTEAPAVKKPAKVAETKLPTPTEIKAAVPGGKKPWAINVASFSKKAPALALAEELRKVGYNTYVTDFLKGSVRWYRVRVGFFTTREDAIKFGEKLGVKLRLPSKPWPVRPQWDEISANIKK